MRGPERIETGNIAEHLPRMARAQPDALALAVSKLLGDYELVRYRDLDLASAELARGFRALGLVRGKRAAVMITPSLELFAVVFALFRIGAVPVMVDPAMGAKNLAACLDHARPWAFIGIGRAQLARTLLGWGRAHIELTIHVGAHLPGQRSLDEVRALGRATKDDDLVETDRDDTAAILFTSGSTGVPKGAVYTHGNFLAQVEAIGDMMGIAPGEIDLPTFPLFALFDPALGMTTVLPVMDFSRPGRANGARIVEAIQRFQCTQMFASPALLARLTTYANAHDIRLPSLRRVITAGAPVRPRILEEARRCLAPEARIYTPYGATEALPIALVDDRILLGDGDREGTRVQTDRGAGICVGAPVPSAQLTLIAIEDGPIATIDEARTVGVGEIGEIAVRGPQVTTSYFDDAPNTALHKMTSADGTLHRVGDLGRLDEEGRLWFLGRKSHRVVDAGGRLHVSEAVEGPFNAHPAVHRAALISLGEGPTKRPAICIELVAGELRNAAMAARLFDHARGFDTAREIDELFFHPRFPVDVRHNAKIDREALGHWARGHLSRAHRRSHA